MSEVKKSDLIYLQNEILKDMAAMDKKFSDKITQLTNALQNNKLITDQKFEMSNENYSSLLEKIESNEDISNIKTQFSLFKEQINQSQLINTNKIFTIEKDLKEACYKYDNYFKNNIFTPGLIGNGAKYKDLKAFREFIDKKISDLVIYKDKNTIEFKKYREKTDNSIESFKSKNEKSEKIYFEFCNDKIIEAKKELMDKFKLLEESLNNIKIENGQYSFDLLKKSEDLQNKINAINNIENMVNTKLKEQEGKYQKYNDDITKLFESQKSEFTLIKSRFTELSEFIKDVRFMRNLNNYKGKGNQNNEINTTSFLRDSRMLSRKLNFDKPQKLSKNDEIIYSIKTDIENNKENNDIKNIINQEKEILVEEQEQEQEQNKEKNKYNIKTNINISKNLNSPNIRNNIKTENNSYISSSSKKMNNTFINIFKGRNENISLRNESPQNETMKGRIIETNKDEFIKNKSDIYFRKQNKTQENDKNKNLKLKTIEKNFTKENSYFNTNIKIKEFSEPELTNNENEINKEIKSALDKINNLIETQILDINKKIKEMNTSNKYNIDKINKKLDLYINLNNVLLLKFKNPKNLSNKQLKILRNHDFNIPLLNNTFEINKNKIRLDKIKINSKENSSILNTKEIKAINDNNKEIKDSKDKRDIDINDNYQGPNSGKILSIIEPYLIKKFRDDSK